MPTKETWGKNITAFCELREGESMLIDADARRYSVIRSTASQLRKKGYQFKVEKLNNDKVRITRQDKKGKQMEKITLNEYQAMALATRMEECENWVYSCGLLHEEAGEVQGKVDKAVRKGLAVINENQLCYHGDGFSDFRNSLLLELGDVLWALASCADVLGASLEEVAMMNIAKLRARKQNGTIDGAGDGTTKAERNG